MADFTFLQGDNSLRNKWADNYINPFYLRMMGVNFGKSPKTGQLIQFEMISFSS